MNFLDNITFRRTRTKSDSILNDSEVVANKSTLNETVTSVPEMSDDEDDIVKKLREQITHLTLELQNAHLEIESLSGENNNLKALNEKLSKNNDVNKNVTLTPTKLQTSNSKRNKSSNNKTNKQTQTETPKSKINNDINKLTPPRENIVKNYSKRNKICIISTDNKNNLLYTAQNVFENCELCHYVTPHASMQVLLKGIRAKLANLTSLDYCVILLGEEDFKVTNRYLDDILQIRKDLQEITNTNIIICTPTYKFFTNNYLYNSRVETFNNLLYLDTITHEHAYFLDSNENLIYDDTMFDRRTGAINRFGMQSLFKDIYRMTVYIESSIASCKYGADQNKEMSPSQNNIPKPTPQKLFRS